MKKIFLLLVFLLWASSVQAANYWTRPTGTMSGCTPSASAPGADSGYKSTINAGISCLASGDTLFVRTGTYAETLGYWGSVPPSGSSFSAPTTISSYNSEVVTISGAGGNPPVILYSSANSYIVFDGLKLDTGGVGTMTPFYVGNGANHIRLIRSEITGGGNPNAGAIDLTGGTSGGFNEIIDNHIHHNGVSTQLDHCIYVQSNGNLIRGNDIHHCAAAGIQFYNNGSGQLYTGNVVERNLIHSNAVGLFAWNLDAPLIHTNIFYSHTSEGISVNDTINLKLYNNTITTSTGHGIYVQNTYGTAAVTNNISYNNTAGQITDGGGNSNLVLTTNRTTDPTFMNAGAQNFSLDTTSDAIDAGTVIAGFSAGRYVGSLPDIGALESPIRSSAAVENATPTIYSVTYSLPSQSVRNGVGLLGCTTANWAMVVGGAGATESACNFTQTGRVDVTLSSAVTNGQSLTDAYTRGTLTDNVCIGTDQGGGTCKYATIRSHTALGGTNNVGGAGSQTWAVIHFRQRDWYGALTGAKWKRAEDVDGFTIPGGRIAIDLAIDCTAANCDPTAFDWWADENAGTPFAITDVVTTNKLGFSNTAPSVSDLQSIAAATLTDPHSSFVSGAVVGQQASQPTVDLTQNSTTQIRLLLQVSSAATPGTQFRIFARRAGSGSNITMTKTPSFTIIAEQAGG